MGPQQSLWIGFEVPNTARTCSIFVRSELADLESLNFDERFRSSITSDLAPNPTEVEPSYLVHALTVA